MAGSKIELGELYWKITAENTDLKRKLKDSEKGATKTSGALKGIGSAAVLAGFTAAAIGVFKVSKALVGAASEAQEVQNKFDVVFNGLDKSAGETAESLAQNYGLARTEAKNLLANTADLLNGFGLAKDSSLELSNGVQQLAVDLASFQNLEGGAARASEILTKGLLGETESLKSLGIAINQTELKKYAEDNGQVFEALTKAEKAQLTYNLAIQQSGNALGDYERSSDSFANVQRQIGALIDDIKVTLGEQLLPIVSEFAVKIRDLLKGFADGIQPMGKFREAVRVVGAIIGKYANLLVDQYIGYFNLFKDAIEDLSGVLGKDDDGLTNVTKGLEVAMNTLGAGLAIVMGIVDLNIKVYSGLIKTIIRAVNVVIEGAKVMGNSMKILKGELSIGDATTDFRESIKDFGVGAKNDFMDVINVFPDTAKAVLKAYEDTLLEAEDVKKKIDKAAGKTKPTTGDGKKKKKKLLSDDQQDNLDMFSELSSTVLNEAQALADAVSTIYDARIDKLTSIYDKELEMIDRNAEAQKQAILANGMSAEEQAAELEILNDRTAAKKAEKDKELAKKKADLEYKGAVLGWGVQLASAVSQAPVAVLNAASAGFRIGPVTAGIFAGIATAAAAAQVAAVIASKPKRPSFAVGTTNVPADMTANIHKNEMIIPADFAEGLRKGDVSLGAGNGGGGGSSPIYLDGDMVGKWLFKAQQDGRVNTAKASIV